MVVERNEEGSTLILVLGAVLILTIMMTSLYSVSNQSLMEMKQSQDFAKAQTLAKSGIISAYYQMQNQWKEDSQADLTNLGTAEGALTNLAEQINQLHVWDGTGITVNVVAPSNDFYNNFSQVNDKNEAATASDLYQNYAVTVTGKSGNATQTLYAIFRVSGIIDAFNYAVYTPGNLTIYGSPEIDGSLSVGQGVYFDTHPWAGWTDDANMYREPDGYEPLVLPDFGGGSSLLSNSINSFTSINSSDYSASISDFLDTTKITDAQPISIEPGGTNVLDKYASGSPTVGTPLSLLGPTFVTDSVTSAEAKYEPLAMQNVFNDESWLPDGGYISLVDPHRHKGTFDYQKSEILQSTMPIYIDGSLTIDSGASLTLSQPLIVTGDLSVQGYLSSSSAIYVQGNTTITSVPRDTSNNQRHLVIISGQNVTLENDQETTASSPATFQAFILSGGTMKLLGMGNYYHIIGGIAAQEIVLDSTVGGDQISDYPYLKSGDFNDLSRRLTITYDPYYAEWPAYGTPTVNNLTLQGPIPQAATIQPKNWPTS